MTNGTQWRSWLDNDKWFSELPGSLQDSLLTVMRQRRVTPGKRVFEYGKPACGLYALLDGSIRFNDLKSQQQWQPQPTQVRPYWFGEVSLFDEQPRLRDAYAEGQVILLHLPQAPLQALLRDHPHYWRWFGQLLGRKLGLMVPPPDELRLMPTKERVAFRLLMLAEGYGDMDRSTRVVPVHDILSRRRLGLLPEVVERVIAEFAERGILRGEHDAIHILDTDRLRKAALHRLTPLIA
ncbi:cAMP-binding domain of CRP or a regulatory subunit of cAMP-dependent protein kinases [Pseudomonas sp. NFACC02]|uniref:Crp/Fnr family transcriptional regulator n=1 Tax=Pseudomonas sp. NFACC02 TaxID=1566250 RepID=UPI0008C3357E|nr:Crp/Fnr family transcriptional regulator [Pseudomonas sp. NFACC02]SER61584.1 cAMP-binding domain of CRP or a regulatory subunit of cAMP-dependent protein kinases [Pseudomonas sp. NFACC02]